MSTSTVGIVNIIAPFGHPWTHLHPHPCSIVDHICCIPTMHNVQYQSIYLYFQQMTFLTACLENIVQCAFFFLFFVFVFGNAHCELGTDKVLGETIVHAPTEVCLEHKRHVPCHVGCLHETQLEQVLRCEQQHMHKGLQQVCIPALASALHMQRMPAHTGSAPHICPRARPSP